MEDQLDYLKVSSIKPLDSVPVQDYLTVNRMNNIVIKNLCLDASASGVVSTANNGGFTSVRTRVI